MDAEAELAINECRKDFQENKLVLLMLEDATQRGAARWVAVIENINSIEGGKTKFEFSCCHQLEGAPKNVGESLSSASPYVFIPTPPYTLMDPTGVLAECAKTAANTYAYRKALEAVDEHMSDSQVAMLFAHFTANDSCESLPNLARAAGYTSVAKAKADYAALGNAIANAMGDLATGRGIAAFAVQVDELDDTGHPKWGLFHEVESAIVELGWFGDEASAEA